MTEQIGAEEVNKLIQTIKVFGQCANGTYTVGLDLSGTPSIWQFDGTIGISIDTEGNVVLQGVFLAGSTSSKPAGGKCMKWIAVNSQEEVDF